MGVSGLHVEVRGDGSILQGHEGVEEGDVLSGPFCRELDGGMCVVEFLHKAQQCLLPVAPDGKDVVDVTPPDEGLDDGGGQDPLLKLGHEDVGIGGGHPSAHGRSAFASRSSSTTATRKERIHSLKKKTPSPQGVLPRQRLGRRGSTA